jgi:hypothetical protein
VKAVPAGFRQAPSGLIVPQQGRESSTWTHAEWKLLNRVRKLLNSKGIYLLMQCQDPQCLSPIHPVLKDDGSVLLRCDHADRRLQRAF